MNIEDYTQQPLDKEGVYRAWPISWALQESTKDESKSVAVAIRFVVHQMWHGKDVGWSQPYPAGWFCDGHVWIVKKDGSLNQGAIANLQKCGLWDGDFDKFMQPPPNYFVHIDVGSEQYEGKLRYRANWVNPDADEPSVRGGFQPTNPDLVQSLRQRFQPQTKAIAGGQRTGAPPPPPAAPAPAITTPQPPQQPQAAPQAAPQPPAVGGGQPRPTAAPTQQAPAQAPQAPQGVPGPQARPQPQIAVPPPTGELDDPIDVDETPF